MTHLPETADIVIVGAGPTGLALAAELRRRGLAPVLLDQQAEGANTSRAAVVHAHTLEVLEPLGVVPDLLREGIEVPIFHIRDRDRVLMRADFSQLPTRYNYSLMCPQNRTEAVLLARLRALGGDVTRPARVTGVTRDGESTRLSVEMEGGTQTIACRWLVGCDGMHSQVREAAGIGFIGGAYKQSFVLADVRFDGPVDKDVSLFLSPDGLVLLAALPHDHFRIVATADEAPETPSRAFVQAILDARGPQRKTLVIRDVAWSSRFHVHHRVAERLRTDNILLCGDAAHVHSPAGGQGMNTGIQDAVELADALADMVGGAAMARLDAWEERRHKIAKRVVALTDRMTRMATARGPGALLRNGVLGVAGRIPAVGRAIAFRAAGLDLR